MGAQAIISLKRVIEATKYAWWDAQQCAGNIDLGIGRLLSDKKLKRRTTQLTHALREYMASVHWVPRWLPICLGTQSKESKWRLWSMGSWRLDLHSWTVLPSFLAGASDSAEVLNSTWEQILYLGSSDREDPGEGHQRENKACCPLAAQICWLSLVTGRVVRH